MTKWISKDVVIMSILNVKKRVLNINYTNYEEYIYIIERLMEIFREKGIDVGITNETDCIKQVNIGNNILCINSKYGLISINDNVYINNCFQVQKMADKMSLSLSIKINEIINDENIILNLLIKYKEEEIKYLNKFIHSDKDSKVKEYVK